MDNTNKGFWERFAFLYTRFMKKNDVTYDIISRDIAPFLNKGMSVLELACGTGQISFRLADNVSKWVATDFSSKMVEEAKKRNNKDITFAVADATNLQYETGTFNAVVIANALHIMPDPDAALKEIYRVLKTDGVLFAPTFVYEKGYNKLKIWVLEKAGFKTFHKWSAKEFVTYIEEHNFNVESQNLIKGNPLFECSLRGKRH
jgi:ubiquinone/menaquinone biosynthesis C-methylase UbiE